MIQRTVFNHRLIAMFIWAAAVTLGGCFESLEDLTCEENSDCASGVCSHGFCSGEVIPRDSESASVFEPDSQTGVVSDSDTVVEPPPYGETLDGIDVIFVVDNSGSMAEEQKLLSTSMYSLVNELTRTSAGVGLDVRVGVTTTDMGVAYSGGVYDGADVEKLFANDRVRCYDNGDNGEFLTSYLESSNDFEVPVFDRMIQCAADGDCPIDWSCESPDMNGVGVCIPTMANSALVCPDVSSYLADNGFLTSVNTATGEVNFPEFVAATACMLQPGINGCNYERPLAAGSAAMNHLASAGALRPNALTVIVLITDEEDCSVQDEQWFDLDELRQTTANVACGRHRELLQNVHNLKTQIINAKSMATGYNATDSVLFAAITGVPVGSVCEGRGDRIGDCLNVKPGVNGNGTMGNPDEIERAVSASQTQTYFEYACQREADGKVVTAAYPATRIVEMAQEFGDMGFVFSICNDNWTPLMQQLGSTILEKVVPKSIL
ncbi:MAG: hypothetical protein JXR76_20760 [Deltaproteobacteria bacterium]|nr:hypothetical protein [Deltaproteobacteria bacterium]